MIEEVEAVLALLCPGIRVNMSGVANAQLSCSQKLEIVVELEDQQDQHAVEELPVDGAVEHSEDEDEDESGGVCTSTCIDLLILSQCYNISDRMDKEDPRPGQED